MANPPTKAPTNGKKIPAATNGHQHHESQCCVFVCNVCLDQAKDPVITFCGHLFCWPCLHQWLQTKTGRNKVCPVCKAQVNKSYPALPVYGRGTDTGATLASGSIPPKPKPISGSLVNASSSERFFVVPEENVLKLVILYSILTIIFYLFA